MTDSANRAVAKAIKAGAIKRGPCEVCGKARAVAHHDDYDYPLVVRWLCTTHHAEWHRLNGPGKNHDKLVQRQRLERAGKRMKPGRGRLDMKISPERRAQYEAAAREDVVPLSVWIRLVLDAEIKRRKRRHP